MAVSKNTLTPYWIRLRGCETPFGVTALNHLEAMRIIEDEVFEGKTSPPPSIIVGKIRASDLDEYHVQPNIGQMDEKGIWFPS